jgi:hypothetical protein
MTRRRYTFPFYGPPGRPAGPYLPIRLVNPIDKVSFVWNCLVDTGADSCLFTAALARLTGHNLAGDGVRSDVTAGIEGKQLLTYKHTFVLELLDPKEPEKVVWRSRQMLFECLNHDDFPPLLGVSDFLRHFTVANRGRRQRVAEQIISSIVAPDVQIV